MHVQVRHDDGSTPTFETIEQAMRVAELDATIWKISWTDETTGERVRLVRDTNNHGVTFWRYDPIVLRHHRPVSY